MATSVTGPFPFLLAHIAIVHPACPLCGPVRQELGSDGMLVQDKKWNVVYIHVLCWRRNTDYIHVVWGGHLVCEGVT